jgi:radical SAM protein with 4Fe4S-binding SPASM domain
MKPVVLADGEVNACACRDVEAELRVGNLRHQSLDQVWNGKAVEALIERHERGDYPEICRRCTYYVSVYNPLESRISKPSLNWKD